MNYFNPAFVKFFKELAKNNTTTWFNENRKAYEKEVKEPFQLFVTELINRVQKSDPSVNIKASDAIMRINKDIRFSKEKIPYNTYVGAIISPYGKKSKEYPGLYIQLGADRIMLFGGAYMLEKDNLHKVRTYIAKHPAELTKVLSAKPFTEKFGTIQGEKNKVLPPEFKTFAEKQPLIANKSFYFSAELPAKSLVSEQLADLVMAYYQAGKPMNDFLVKALGN